MSEKHFVVFDHQATSFIAPQIELEDKLNELFANGYTIAHTFPVGDEQRFIMEKFMYEIPGGDNALF
jgi:hypothetical protein